MDNGQLRNPFGMIIKSQNMSENKWNHFKIVPQGHNNCQLSIVNCQFGEATKFLFIGQLRKPKITVSYISYLISQIYPILKRETEAMQKPEALFCMDDCTNPLNPA